MTKVEHSIVINANLEQIDEVVLNGNRLPEWYAGMESAVADATYPQPGGTIDVVYKSAGINFKMKIISLRWVAGKSLRSRMEGMITGTNHWVYQPEGDGIRLTATFEYEMPGGGVGQAINKLVIEKMNTDNLAKSLENLKALVEG